MSKHENAGQDRKRDRPASNSDTNVEGSGSNAFDSLFWHGKSCRPFWGTHRNVVQAGNSYRGTRDDGRKT